MLAATRIANVLFTLALIGTLWTGNARAQPPLTDLHGDPLPSGAVLRLGTVRFRHAQTVTTVVFSPNGKTVATGGYDESIRLWDAATGKPIRAWATPHRYGVQCVAFAPDGKTIASAGHHSIRIWATDTGKELHALTGHQGWISTVAFSPDSNTLVSASSDQTVRLWDAATGKEQRVLARHSQHVFRAEFSPDGKSIAFASSDNTVRLWDVSAAKEIRVLTGHQQAVHALAFAPDGNLVASASADTTIRLWEAATGKEVRTLTGHQKAVTALAIAEGGKLLASSSRDNTVRLWDMEAGKEIQALAGNGPVAFAPDGKTLAGGFGGMVRLWDTATGAEIFPDTAHRSPVLAVGFAPDGKSLVSAGRSALRRWDLPAATNSQTLTTQGSLAAAFSKDGKIAVVACADETIRVWEPATGQALRAWGLEKDTRIASLALTPNGKTLAGGSRDGMIRLWEITGNEVRKNLTGHQGSVSALVFAPDGKTLASAGSYGDQTVRLWSLATGKDILTLWQPGPIDAIAFAPDGKTLACVAGYYSDKMIRLWDVSTGKLLRTLPGHGNRLQSVLFAPDGKTLAVAGGENDYYRGAGEIRLWETATGLEIRRWTGHQAVVHSVAFTPDGKTLASASADTTVLLWPLFADVPRGGDLSEKALQAFWTDLAGSDAPRAYRAIGALAACPPQSLPFLRQHLPRPFPEPQEVAQWVADLDSKEFVARQKATQALEKLGLAAEPALRGALAGKPALELRQRLEQVLETVTVLSAEELRWLRASQVLELIGTEARPLLETLAADAPSLRLRTEAKAALLRQE